jgi:phosphate starvation-inducible PhoH-like protein
LPLVATNSAAPSAAAGLAIGGSLDPAATFGYPESVGSSDAFVDRFSPGGRTDLRRPLWVAALPMRRTVEIAGQVENLFGTLDENLKLLESSLHVATYLDDNRLVIEGDAPQVDRAVRILNQYNDLVREGRRLDNGAVKDLLRVATEAPNETLRGILEPGQPSKPRLFGKKSVTPKSSNQRRYMEDIERHDMVFAIGPGGTGKTYLAVAMAVSALLGKQVNRIILARPAVEAGERLGFLPGTLQQKIDPYMRPLYDALYDLLDADKLERFIDKGIIEVAPLAFMRGRTLNDSFVILDEAQNTTSEQMKMFLTRLGFNSKAVITGDITQTDLPVGRRSGLVEAIEVVGRIEGIAFVHFNERDVVRHNLVQQIIKAYDEFASTPVSRPASTGPAATEPSGGAGNSPANGKNDAAK